MMKRLLLALFILLASCNKEPHGNIMNVDGVKWYLGIDGGAYDLSDALNACPKGYHLPDQYEWMTFIVRYDKNSPTFKSPFWTSSYEATQLRRSPYRFFKISGKYKVSSNSENDKYEIACVENSLLERDKVSENYFYGPASLEVDEPACIDDFVYVDVKDESLLLCRDKKFRRLTKRMIRLSDTVNANADTVVKSLRHLFPCTYGLNGKVFMTGNDFYLYQCKNYKWHGLGYAKRKGFPKGAAYDSLSGESYKTITVGSTKWMAENLRKKVPGSVCYDNEPDNCKKYGRMYPSYKDGMCPAGWTLPAKGDWDQLFTEVGLYGAYLRSEDGWFLDFKENKDIGFSVYPAGWFGRRRSYDEPAFLDLSMRTAWFSYDDAGRVFSIMFDGESFDYSYAVVGSKLYIRCVQKE